MVRIISILYVFQNLTPATKYYYRVTVDSSEYKGSFYSAPDENVDSLKFLVYGDNRTYPENHDKVTKQIVNLFESDSAHFVIVDKYTSYSVGSTQYNWLKNDLETTNKKWKFIILHAPGWSAGGHNNASYVQNAIQLLCAQNNVQIVFGGHNHYYARAVVEGVTHITSGGAPLYDADPNYPNIVVTSKTNHFCKIKISGDDLYFKAINSSGNQIDAFTMTLTDVDENKKEQLPTEFSLEQNYPNPFNPSTIIKYSIPAVGTGRAPSVRLIVYDILGREVATLVNKEQKAGSYEVQFDASNLTSGVYYYRIQVGSFIDAKKMTLFK